ncbi:MAG: DUF3179 domain-containing protein [Planctomycetota bacterium]|jgi:hypothetical protein
MQPPPDEAGRRPYEWTPRRIALGAFLVAAGITFVSVTAWQVFGQDVTAARPDPGAARKARGRAAVNAQFNLDDLIIPAEQILFGGPPKDGIPALTEPETVPIEQADYLRDDDRVIGVEVGGEARAYPLRVLIWHEAVNDRLGGVPIAVIYCPLCVSVSVVDRRLEGETREFGISGLLHNSNVLLYDRADDSLWTQLGFTAISGPNAGRTLRHLPWAFTTLREWGVTHPGATVLTLNTGYDRDYGWHPYGDYFENDRLMFPVAREDPRLGRKEPIVGVRWADGIRAYPVREIHDAPEGVVRDAIAGGTVVLRADPATGSVRIMEAPDDALVVHTYWFAWAAFHPETEIWERGQPSAISHQEGNRQ